jgi:SNF2 family DNA or RNA helicase
VKVTIHNGYWWIKDTNGTIEGSLVSSKIPEARWQKKKAMYKAPDTFRTRDALLDLIEWHELNATDVAYARLDVHQSETKSNDYYPFPSSYPFKTICYGHQSAILDETYSKDNYALFWEAGAGKTKPSIDLLSAWGFKLNVIVPLNSLVRVWRSEIEIHCPYDVVIYDVDDLKKGRIDLTSDAIVYVIIGVESLSSGKAYPDLLKIMKKQSNGSDGIAMVVDESSSIKNHKAERTKRVTKLGDHAGKKLILNGTPISNGYHELYSQMRFLDTEILGFNSFLAFRNRYVIMGGYEDKQIVGYRNTDELFALIAPHSSLLRKEDVISSLPPKLPMQKRYVKLSAEQKRLYRDCKDRELVFEGNEIDLDIVLTVYLRLQQIVGGFLPIDDEGTVQSIAGPNPKGNEILSIMELHPDDNVVVFCRFVGEALMLHDMIKGSALFTGSNADADSQLTDFMEGNKRVIITTYGKAAKGHNWQHAGVMIMFSLNFSFEMYSQAMDRIHRATTTVSPTYYSIIAEGTVDEDILKALTTKKSLADHLAVELKK